MDKQTLFIADLHLSAATPQENAVFHRLLNTSTIDSLYILGDFFALWIGDDVPDSTSATICDWLRTASQRIKIYLMPGNRDFLINDTFAKKCGVNLLKDPTVIDLYGTPTLLTHGDALCTEDRRYQQWRRLTRYVWLQKLFLNLPCRLRRKIADRVRAQSQVKVTTLSTKQMDVTFEAVCKFMLKYRVLQMIHGHTHQPGLHYFNWQNTKYYRWVLGDWQWQMQGLMASPAEPLQVVYFEE